MQRNVTGRTHICGAISFLCSNAAAKDSLKLIKDFNKKQSDKLGEENS